MKKVLLLLLAAIWVLSGISVDSGTGTKPAARSRRPPNCGAFDRVGKQTRISNLSAQIFEVEEEPTEVRILIRPHPLYGAVPMMPLGH